MNTPKRVPRFIPTLTEVVDPTSLHGLVEQSQSDMQALVQEVQRELQLVLERRLQQEMEQFQRTVLAEQWQAMRLRLKQDMDEMVRQALVKSVAIDADRVGSEVISRVSTES